MYQERKAVAVAVAAFWIICAAEQASGRDGNGNKLESHKAPARWDHWAHERLSENLSPDQTSKLQARELRQ